jgi:hypothetical protein
MISAATLVALAAQGCTKAPPPVVTSTTRVYAHDMEGKAALCTAPYSALAPVAGKDNVVTITTGGNGWCGVPVRNDTGPYTAGLLTEAAHNGKVIVHTVGDDTRIDYVAKAGPVLADSFAVRLVPGDAVMRVTVNPPAGATPVAATAPVPTPAGGKAPASTAGK